MSYTCFTGTIFHSVENKLMILKEKKMKQILTGFSKMILLSMAISLISVGCVSQKSPPPDVVVNCPLPSGYLVDQAFSTARSTLSNPPCRYQFDAVFATLLTVCEGAPDMKNKELFSELLLWAKGEGIISSIQAEKYYTRYFSHRFVSLPDTYQTCSHCTGLKTMLANCREELKNKEQGLIKVCKDKATYAKASDDLSKIEVILEATCRSCAAE